MAFGRGCLAEWPLDPAVTYLNHGTVGVTPREVLAVQRQMRDRVERAPAQVIFREHAGMLGGDDAGQSGVREAAAAVATFIGARPEDVVFVDNATTGINAVLRSMPLGPGDEVVLTSDAYGAVQNAVHAIAGARGASVLSVPVASTAFSPDALVRDFDAVLSTRTKLVLVDHITAESALILPLAEIASLCRARGVRVLVDGAHAPGVLTLDVPALGVDYYVGNLHKWACAPRPCAFLWAAQAVQEGLHPAVISWGLGEGFSAEFDWTGTRDFTPWLAAPAGLAFLRRQSPEAMWAWNHGLAWRGACRLAEAWGTDLPAGEADIGFMATVEAPGGVGGEPADALRLRERLLVEHGIEVQVHSRHGRVAVRISAQVYNEMADIERLAGAVLAIAGGR